MMSRENTASSAPEIEKIVLYDNAFVSQKEINDIIVHELGHFIYKLMEVNDKNNLRMNIYILLVGRRLIMEMVKFRLFLLDGNMYFPMEFSLQRKIFQIM